MKKARKKESMTTIAAKAGCSPSTVSRILNGVAEKNRISPETTERVLAALRDSAYIPPRSTKNLREGKADIIGLLVPSVANPYFAEMAGALVSEAYSHHYAATLMDAQEDEGRFLDCLRMMDAADLPGIIAVPCGNSLSVLEKVGCRTPLVLLDRYFNETSLPVVTCNNYQGGFDAANALISSGCRKIVAIQGPESSLPSLERVRGYRDAMSQAGLGEFIKVVGYEFSQHCGYVETKYLLSGQDVPDAIFALSNNIMLGCVKALRESNLSIPEDISLICFDDGPFMNLMSPSVSCVAQPVRDMASLAFKILLDRIHGDFALTSKITLSPELKMRGSVRTI